MKRPDTPCSEPPYDVAVFLSGRSSISVIAATLLLKPCDTVQFLLVSEIVPLSRAAGALVFPVMVMRARGRRVMTVSGL